MAREVDDDDDDSLAPIGDGTMEFLQDAKKGKPRNFMLICKGNKVRFLQVKKKAVKKAEVAAAKKLGYKGDVCVGVITGGGQALVFNLSIADGYTSEPCKEKSLKDFLSEHADYKCQPTFALVQVAPEVPFDEEDLANPVIARFLSLAPLIVEASEKSVTQASEIQLSREKIRQSLLEENFNEATQLLDAFEQTLQAIISSQPNTGAPQPQAASSSALPNPSNDSQANNTKANDGDQALRVKLIDTIAKMGPQIKEAASKDPNQKESIVDAVTKAKEYIKQGNAPEARQAVLSLAQLLKTILSSPTQPNTQQQSSTQTTPDADAALIEFRKRQRELEPKYLEALKLAPEKASALSSVWAYADENASRQVFEKANQALERLSLAISKLAPTKTDTAPNFKVWEEASQKARFQIRRFQLALRATRHPTAFQIVDVLEDLADRLEEVPANRSEAIEFDLFLETDPTITSFERPNPFGLTVEVRKPLRQALSELMASLPS